MHQLASKSLVLDDKKTKSELNQRMFLEANNNNIYMIHKTLIDGANILYTDKEGQNVLHFLVVHPFSDPIQHIIWYAIKQGVDPERPNKHNHSARDIRNLFQNPYDLERR
jgi:hypothetical protein